MFKMAFVEEGQHWVIGSVGIIFVIVGASKWLFDVLILNSFAYYKIYLIMIILGAVCTGYVRLEKALVKILGRV